MSTPLLEETIERKIYFIRGKKVMLDSDLAYLYGVSTGALIQAVKRNRDRFPNDLLYLLTREEVTALISQFVISKKGRGGRTKLPHAFTEQGIAMLSSVLKSKRAVQVNIQIMRTFTKLRELLATHEDLRRKIEAIERNFSKKFGEHDHQFEAVFDAINRLLEPAAKKRKRLIGFHP